MFACSQFAVLRLSRKIPAKGDRARVPTRGFRLHAGSIASGQQNPSTIQYTIHRSRSVFASTSCINFKECSIAHAIAKGHFIALIKSMSTGWMQ